MKQIVLEEVTTEDLVDMESYMVWFEGPPFFGEIVSAVYDKGTWIFDNGPDIDVAPYSRVFEYPRSKMIEEKGKA